MYPQIDISFTVEDLCEESVQVVEDWARSPGSCGVRALLYELSLSPVVDALWMILLGGVVIALLYWLMCMVS